MASNHQPLADSEQTKSHLVILLLLVASICIMEGSINFLIGRWNRKPALNRRLAAQNARLARLQAIERRLAILQRRREFLEYFMLRQVRSSQQPNQR